MAESIEKLRLLTETNDGFLIAQKDLENRGAGELFGYRQSGLAASCVSSLAADARLLEETHEAARRVFRFPDSAESKAVMALAQSTFEKRLCEISPN